MHGAQGGEIRVLGPIEIVGEQGAVAEPAPKERQLLAALLAQPGKARSRDALVDALWGASPPASAPKLLQISVSKLRRLLPPSIAIRTREAGYALVLGHGMLDAARFEHLLAEGVEAARAGNPALAATTLRRGLELWRGPAYGALAFDESARAEAERLEELRAVAVEERLAAELELGRHGDLLPELLGLADTHPLRERFQALAMLALYRSGRQAEALDRYAASRRRLRDELGLEPGAELRDLQVRILQQDPALAPAGDRESVDVSLPVPPNALLGRSRELAELDGLLRRDDVRLLVLTGAGGSGKTRLAIEAARRSASLFANGAALVELAPVHDPGLLVGVISTALRVEQLAGEPLENLVEALRPRETLLLLDNFEHLREAAPLLVELLSQAPRLTVLVTSRAVLHLSGEHVYPVEPLGEPDAVALFVTRAREADARFEPDSEARSVIRLICERLDRLPLAIELAAGRIRTRTPSELLDGLEQRIPVLAGGPRDLPARQRTLRATLEWSLDLLTELERRDLARLSVFAGGWSLEAAEAVCESTLDRLSSLVDHNLVLRAVGPQGSRYSLLETIREQASEELEASGEADAVRRRHAEHALLVAESLGLSVDEIGTGVRQRFDVVRLEQDNLRAALDWAADADPELGIRLALAVEQLWVATNPREGIARFETLLARAPDLPPALRARALRDLGGSMEIAGRPEQAAEHYRASLELYEQLEDDAGVLHMQFRVAGALLEGLDLAAARQVAESGLERARRGRFRMQEADFIHLLSAIAFEGGDVAAACDLERRSLELYRELGGWEWGDALKLARLATYSAMLGRLDEAEQYGLEALEISHRIGDRRKVVLSLAALALAARGRGDGEHAGRLWGAIEAEEGRSLLGNWGQVREEYADSVLLPSSPTLELGLEAGRVMTLAEAAVYALETWDAR